MVAGIHAIFVLLVDNSLADPATWWFGKGGASWPKSLVGDRYPLDERCPEIPIAAALAMIYGAASLAAVTGRVRDPMMGGFPFAHLA